LNPVDPSIRLRKRLVSKSAWFQPVNLKYDPGFKVRFYIFQQLVPLRQGEARRREGQQYASPRRGGGGW
jgi:hypothetical protein